MGLGQQDLGTTLPDRPKAGPHEPWNERRSQLAVRDRRGAETTGMQGRPRVEDFRVGNSPGGRVLAISRHTEINTKNTVHH